MFKSIAQNVRFVAIGVLASGLAFANASTTNTIGSYVGSNGGTLVNTPLTYNGAALFNPVYGYYLPGTYTAPFAGTAYVNDDPTGNNPVGIQYYTTTFTGAYAGTTGTIDFLVDNDLGITINNVNILPDAQRTLYSTFQSTGQIVDIPAGVLVDGLNIVVFDVFNSGGPAAFDFTGTVTDTCTPAATPEPSSLVLLGTGVLGLAGAVRRRISK